jgi:hypothetical protein
MIQTQPQERNYRIEFDHFASVTEAVSTVTVNPINSIVSFLIPSGAAWIAWHTEVRADDPLQTTLISRKAALAAIERVNQLKNLAGISREVTLYTSDQYSCTSFGGNWSLMSPGISIPRGFLTAATQTIFESETFPGHPAADIPEPAAHWKFTEDEVMFMMAREVSTIASVNGIARLISKVIFVSALIFLLAAAIPLLAKVALIAAAASLYLIMERSLKIGLDIDGTELLIEYYRSDQAVATPEDRAIAAARTTIEKLITQNLERRETNNLCQAYITEGGNNLLDIANPFLTRRLERLNDYFGR